MAKNVVVIGGGASGMLAAYYSAKNGNNTVIIEKNEKLGKKLYITGKGRCNVTNDCSNDDFLSNVVTNPKFLMSAINAFPPSKMMELLRENGLELKVERGDRVFPLSDKSNDVIKCLSQMCYEAGVKVCLNEKVLNINVENACVNSVKTNKRLYFVDKVIIATGGVSYTLTGSTGDGYDFAKSLGHTIISPIAALSALKIEGSFCSEVMGLSLKNVRLSAISKGKTISEEFGEMLFTHFGVSGPIVLTTSSRINKLIPNGVQLSLDLKPALSDKQLDDRILRDFQELKNKQLKNSLNMLLPRNLIPIVIDKAQLDGEKNTNILTKEERLRLVDAIKRFTMKVSGLAPLEQAIITNGGVSVKEINPKTMESKIVSGLYFCGEVIDVDALTGGFNLQIAFSTAYLAGNDIL